MKIWDIAIESKALLNDAIKNGHCIEWMNGINGIKLKDEPDNDETNSTKLPQWSDMASSIGINPCKNEYGLLKVLDYKIIGCAYGLGNINAPSGNTMIHAQTFNGKLNGSIAYSYPLITHNNGKICADIQYNILNKLCTNDGDTLTINDYLIENPQL